MELPQMAAPADEKGDKLIERLWSACREGNIKDLVACAAAKAPLDSR